MTIYDEIEIEDLHFEADSLSFWYDCPCGDKFRISLDQLKEGYDIAECPSCTLQIKIIFEKEDLEDFNCFDRRIALSA